MNRVSMMGELVASLSHEIAQPIASARNNARAAQNFLDMQPPDLREVREARYFRLNYPPEPIAPARVNYRNGALPALAALVAARPEGAVNTAVWVV